MKRNTTKILAALLAVGICICSTAVRAQTTATVTTTKGAFSEFIPTSKTVVVRTEEEEIEKRQEALEKAKDKLEDDDDH